MSEERKEEFILISSDDIKAGLSGWRLIVYAYLRHKANYHTCYVSLSDLIAFTGITKSSLQAIIKSLIYIKAISVVEKAKGRRKTQYFVNPPNLFCIEKKREKRKPKFANLETIPVGEISEYLLADSNWVKIVAKTTKTIADEIPYKVGEFVDFLVSSGKTVRNKSDVKSHFTNWLMKCEAPRKMNKANMKKIKIGNKYYE